MRYVIEVVEEVFIVLEVYIRKEKDFFSILTGPGKLTESGWSDSDCTKHSQ